MAEVFRINKTKNYTVMSNYHLQDKNLSFEQQEKISNKMIEVADKIAKLDAEHKNFIKDIMKGLGGIAIVGLGFAGAILGINLKKK